MQLADVGKYAIVLFLVYFVAFGLWRMFPIKYEHYSLTKLRDTATRDLSVVGAYDDKFKNSLRYLLETIYQKLYFFRGDNFISTRDKLQDWCPKNTFDPDYTISSMISSVCYDLEKRWDEYKKLKRPDGTEPFNVSLEDADLPSPASTLRNNDHINTESLYTLYYELLKKEL
ncbi:MAG: hypothetical protein NC489_30210 [Ruminococcus flavefaciens]|nr:hypothetical protein [Ruminococcus flavefaciens]